MLDRTTETIEATEAGQNARTPRRRTLGVLLARRARAAIVSLRDSSLVLANGARGVWHVLRTEGIGGAARRTWHFFVVLSVSSLSRRIVFINIVGLAAFVA